MSDPGRMICEPWTPDDDQVRVAPLNVDCDGCRRTIEKGERYVLFELADRKRRLFLKPAPLPTPDRAVVRPLPTACVYDHRPDARERAWA